MCHPFLKEILQLNDIYVVGWGLGSCQSTVNATLYWHLWWANFWQVQTHAGCVALCSRQIYLSSPGQGGIRECASRIDPGREVRTLKFRPSSFKLRCTWFRWYKWVNHGKPTAPSLQHNLPLHHHSPSLSSLFEVSFKPSLQNVLPSLTVSTSPLAPSVITSFLPLSQPSVGSAPC